MLRRLRQRPREARPPERRLTATATGAPITRRAAFDLIRYGSVWEDADVLCEALAPVAGGGRLLSVASAGDNALALLTLDPAEVVAADVSPAQLACLELRIAAFRRLEHPDLLEFLGAARRSNAPGAPTGPEGAGAAGRPNAPGARAIAGSDVAPRRLAVYERLRSELPASAAAFWDAHRPSIVRGVIHAGKFERYLRAFRRWVLPLVHSSRTIEDLTRPRPLEERRAFYRERWDDWRWRLVFRLFFSRAVMGRMGRDPEFFAHVDGPVGARLLARTRHALTELPTDSNPYLVHIMTGTFRPEALPRFLRSEHYAAIRARLDRMRVVEASIESAGDGRFEGFNLSDVFEYMSPAEHERTYAALVARARARARIAYWNMLAPRGCPPSQAQRVRVLAEATAALHARDRAWFYQSFHLDEVVEGTAA